MTSKIDWLEKIPVDGKPRKISEWLSYLPEHERTVTLNACNCKDVVCDKMSKALHGAFIWSKTPIKYKTGSKAKGFWKQQYKWNNLFELILDHEQKFLTTDENSEK